MQKVIHCCFVKYCCTSFKLASDTLAIESLYCEVLLIANVIAIRTAGKSTANRSSGRLADKNSRSTK